MRLHARQVPWFLHFFVLHGHLGELNDLDLGIGGNDNNSNGIEEAPEARFEVL